MRLRDKITIQHITGMTTNANGFEVPAWGTYTTVWANKRGLRGREYYQAAAMQSESEVVFEIRYRTDITSDMRIVSDKTYDIKSVSDTEGRKKWLEIHAKEVDQNGG